MVAHSSGFGMRVGRFRRPQKGVEVLAMPDGRLDTTRRVEAVSEVPPGDIVPQLLYPAWRLV